MKLVAQMVGRNEADRFLYQVLKRLSFFTDVIVFTDDCSDDLTPDIAREFCEVFRMDEPTFRVDESKLRTAAWKNLSKYAEPGDWILAIDADEELYGIDHLARLFDQSTHDVLGINFVHMWSPTHYRIDKLWRPNVGSRLFRYIEGGEFANRRMACGSEPTYVRELIRMGKVLWATPLIMKHLGYVRDEDKVAKYHRYMELDQGSFHNLAHLESILDPHPMLIPWVL